VAARVISIGNITVGGSGKTSLAAYIAQTLLTEGKRVAVVARGYGRPSRGPVIVSSESHFDWKQCGDEPAALAKSIPGLKIYVDSSKTEAAIRAAQDGFEYIIVDDGFQHRKLFRDLDIVCLDSNRPFGNRLLLPSGMLREPQSALNRADAFVIMGSNANITRELPSKPIFHARKLIASIKSLSGHAVDIGDQKLIAFCGLGNPESFRKSLAESGCRIDRFLTYRDHYIYSKRDIEKIADYIRQAKLDGAITTLKDFVKIEEFWPSEIPLYRLEITIELDNKSEFDKLIRL